MLKQMLILFTTVAFYLSISSMEDKKRKLEEVIESKPTEESTQKKPHNQAANAKIYACRCQKNAAAYCRQEFKERGAIMRHLREAHNIPVTSQRKDRHYYEKQSVLE